MQIINYEIHNVLKISDLKLNLEGRHLFLVGGRNDEGKSSAIKSLVMALCGRSGTDWPSPALKEGEKEGWVRVRLSAFPEWHEDKHITVSLYFKRGRDGTVAEKFKVTDSTGEEAPTPKTLLKSLYKNRGFDPLAFDRMDKKQRRDVLMQLVGLDLDSYKERHQKIYTERTVLNRQIAAAEAKAMAMPSHALGDNPQPVEELLASLEQTNEHNRQIVVTEDAIESLEKQRDSADAEIERLKEKIKKLTNERDGTKREIKTMTAFLKDLGDKVDTSDINEKIKHNSLLQRQYDENQAQIAAVKEAKELASAADKLTDAIDALNEEQDKAIAEAKWPLPNMKVDDEGVLIDGLPYESACKSNRVLTSTRVGMALNPELRLLVCEDGSDLDPDTLKELGEVLKENDFQMLVEYVTRTSDDEQMCSVVIEDGSMKLLESNA